MYTLICSTILLTANTNTKRFSIRLREWTFQNHDRIRDTAEAAKKNHSHCYRMRAFLFHCLLIPTPTRLPFSIQIFIRTLSLSLLLCLHEWVQHCAPYTCNCICICKFFAEFDEQIVCIHLKVKKTRERKKTSGITLRSKANDTDGEWAWNKYTEEEERG